MREPPARDGRLRTRAPAAIGCALMMVVGLSYRLIPMMLPAAMPTGGALAWSAILIETGLVIVTVALLAGSRWLPVGGVVIAAGLVRFVTRIRQVARSRKPRPPGLPRRDWSVADLVRTARRPSART